MTTAILTDPRYAAHTDPFHVERAERLQAIEQALRVSGLSEDVLALAPRFANPAELAAVHDQAYLDAIQRFCEQGGGQIDLDTYSTDASWEAATLAAGATARAVEAILGGECHNAFALVRPPGHHATPNRAMGFCLINNIAVAARHALNQFGLERVAIVDYDVHHGNGTQAIFYRDGDVLFCSTHAAPFYPGTGDSREMGAGDGIGATLNVPLPFGVGDQGYAQVFTELIIPAVQRWKPQMILVSAGYDGHWNDPLGPMALSVTGYAQLTRMIYDLAGELCDGRLLLVLEGGYNLEALGACVVAALQVLLGRDPGPDPIGIDSGPGTSVNSSITALRRLHPLLAEQ
jgi:acetoin utilization deacetylase AcuC-like enzyme